MHVGNTSYTIFFILGFWANIGKVGSQTGCWLQVSLVWRKLDLLLPLATEMAGCTLVCRGKLNNHWKSGFLLQTNIRKTKRNMQKLRQTLNSLQRLKVLVDGMQIGNDDKMQTGQISCTKDMQRNQRQLICVHLCGLSLFSGPLLWYLWPFLGTENLPLPTSTHYSNVTFPQI